MSQERIRVKITVGRANVEIEAPPERLEQAVREVVAALGGVQAAEPAAEPPKPKRVAKGPTCRALLGSIVAEGWFSSARTLADVVAELARRGYNYDPTAVAHVLLDMVREGILTREGQPRRYLYYQPQSGTAAAEAQKDAAMAE